MTRFASLLAALMFICSSSMALAQSNAQSNDGAAVTLAPSAVMTAPVTAPVPPAAPVLDDSHFQNWETMKSYLDSQGINSNAINWPAIDPSCLGTKMDSGDIAYNKCLYLRAKDSYLFSIQKAQCQTLANAHYPDSLLLQQQTDADQHDKDDKPLPPLSKTDLQNKRDASVLRCMMDLGWASADDWKLGHTTP